MRGRGPARAAGALPYRPCVGIMLLNREGLVFLGRRRGDGGSGQLEDAYAWQMPQGGIDAGERPYEAAVRELYEETGVRSIALLAEAPEWYSYDLPAFVAGRAWKGRYRGQSQKWFAFRFTGSDDEIAINRPGGHKPEFEDWRWERMERLPELIIPFKRPVYEQVVSAFGHLASSVNSKDPASTA
jgi:putative (di)nucleoside polyphosphate hydrolase